MNAKCYLAAASLLTIMPLAAADQTTGLDVRRGVPTAAHLFIFGKHNPERDFQREYLREVWQTVEEERIVERFMEIITSRVPEEDLDQVRGVWSQLTTALEPMRCEAIFDAKGVAYAQIMQPPFNHHLVLAELSSEDAAGFEKAFAQLFDQFQQWSKGEAKKRVAREGEVDFIVLDLPAEVPFRPTLARIGDVIILSDTEELARQSATMLLERSGAAKVDDPRLQEALASLPEPEDALVFFDGKLLFERLHGVADFLRTQAPPDPEAARWFGLMELVIDEFAIFDYEVTVEYTEGEQNRLAVMGRLLDGTQESLLYQALSQGKPFENWQSWVPADAEAYSLSTGVNLHAVYERTMELVRDHIPESHQALDDLEAKQEEIGFHLDRDLLQSFSGETVSVTVPIEAADGSTSPCGVTAMRCSNPDRIRELINLGVERLQDLPPMQAQQLQLVDCEQVEGFQEVEAATLKMFGARPVFGFDDGWMIVSSNPEAVAKVLAARRGEAESIDQAASFQRFDLEIEGPVQAVSYSDLSAATEAAADAIEQIGAMAPMFLGMIAAQAEPEAIEPVQEILGLLPSIAKVVRKFDFLEDQLSVTRQGPTEGTYRRDAVTLVRAPASN